MKKLMMAVYFVTLVMVLPAAGNAASGGHGPSAPKKVGILLVAFGTSDAAARVSFDNIDRKVKAAYPRLPVRWAYTSRVIREKLAKQGMRIDSPEVALAKMMDEKFTHVAVQSLHTIAGAEYHELQQTVEAFGAMGGFREILLGQPLLATQEDMAHAAEAVMEMIPEARRQGEAVVLMGHGTHHPANAFYAALMFQLQLKDPDIFIGTVEGYPPIGLIREMILKKKIQKAWLLPFMSVAGDHAKNDMAGDGADSWKSVLSGAGIRCVPVLKGTAQFDGFVAIWVGHIQDVLLHM